MKETNWDNLVSGDELKKSIKVRHVPYLVKNGWSTSLADEETEGWYYAGDAKTKKQNKSGGTKIILHKDKPFSEQFEDEVWMMFAKMGFTVLNRDRNFTIVYDKNNSFSQQIDVFAADEETVLIVECKAAESRKNATFKKPIGDLGGNADAIRKEIYTRPEFAGKKVKFIWATKNINLDKNDKDRLEGYHISYFNDDTVRYYTQLAEQLGPAARFQLLGDIFRGQDIKNMDMRIPAIEGKMGGFRYYSFSIEPAKLLKIAYVLHHSMAITGSLQTYQRIIKKSRLKEIRKFINSGGYFPNSIIISVDGPKGGLQFDPASVSVDTDLYRIGVLHLPQKYHSAYIIDGQHRLYGYSESDYAETNAIPVVAFVNLQEAEQMKLFMDINENQKAVPKTLRVVLNGDLHWTSPDKNKQRDALRSKLAQQLGTDSGSPLFNRVVLTEDDEADTTGMKCVTLSCLQTALRQGGFFSAYKSGNVKVVNGTYDKESMTDTFELFYPFIRDMLGFIADNCSHEWNELAENGILAINRGVQGCIRVIGELVSLRIEQHRINPLVDSSETIYAEIEELLKPLCEFINKITVEQRTELLKYKGSGGDTKFYRTFEMAIRERYPEYDPIGLSEYLEDETKQFNAQARDYLFAIEKSLREKVSTTLQKVHGDSWMMSSMPLSTYNKLNDKANHKNTAIYAGKETGPITHPWDFATLTMIRDMTIYGSNWTTMFESMLVRPEEKGQPGDKKAKTQWICDLDKIKSKLLGNNSDIYSVKKADFVKIQSIYEWFC